MKFIFKFFQEKLFILKLFFNDLLNRISNLETVYVTKANEQNIVSKNNRVNDSLKNKLIIYVEVINQGITLMFVNIKIISVMIAIKHDI